MSGSTSAGCLVEKMGARMVDETVELWAVTLAALSDEHWAVS